MALDDGGGHPSGPRDLGIASLIVPTRVSCGDKRIQSWSAPAGTGPLRLCFEDEACGGAEGGGVGDVFAFAVAVG